MKKITLRDHRGLLLKNTNRYEEGYEKAKVNWVRHAYGFYRDSLSSREDKQRLRLHLSVMAELTFNAQGRRPLFEIDDLCFAWNSPRFFSDNFIRYEIGHISPRNKGGVSKASNLCFQSARCNQHIQSALNIEDVLFLIGHHESVKARIQSLFDLHASAKWKELERDISSLG